MAKQFVMNDDQKKFVAQIHARYGEGTELAPKAILALAKDVGIDRPNWLFRSEVAKNVSRGKWIVGKIV